MKKSIIVNICGIVLHIDEDAYEILNAYIAELNKYFSAQPGGKEVVNDIENRIAELLQPKLTDNKQSISVEDIEEIISILGKPKDIAGSEEETPNKTNSGKNTQFDDRATRKLYRDMNDAVVGGVAAGMGAYFNIDPIIFRILFIALIFPGGIGIVLYIILWASVPEAVTVSQRLEMKGENVNIDNIEKKIHEEKGAKKFASGKFAGFINQILVAFGKFVIMVMGIFKYVFAVFLILMALFIIVGTIVAMFFSNFAISNGLVSNIGSLEEFLNYFLLPVNTEILMSFGLAIVLLPCIGFIYWGLKILIHFKARDKWLSITMSTAWILCVIVFITILLTEVNRYKIESYDRETIALQAPSKNKLYLSILNNENLIHHYYDDDFQPCLFGVKKNNTNTVMFSPVDLHIKKTQNTQPEIEVLRWANSAEYKEADEARKKIKIHYSLNDTLLTIDPLFRLENTEKWNFQRCKIIIYIPENYGVKVNSDFFELTHRNFYYDFDDEINFNLWWKATENGLELKK